MVPIALDAPERAIVSVVNQERARHGLRALRPSGTLSRAADAHSKDVLRRDVLTHASADGSGFAARIARLGAFGRTGEVIAFSSARRARARSFVRLWLRSPGHRQVMLDPSYTHVGAGRVRGRLGRVGGTVVTLDLGRP